MAIVKLKKLTFYGLIKQKSHSLQQLQQLGGTHLIALKHLPISSTQVTQRDTEKVISALKYLTTCAKKRHQITAKENFNLDVIIAQTLDLQIKIEHLEHRADFLEQRISELEPWGDFVLPELDTALGGIKCWFYRVPKNLMGKITDPNLIWQVVHQDNIHHYLVVLAEQEPVATALPVPRTHTGSVRLSELNKQYQHQQFSFWI